MVAFAKNCENPSPSNNFKVANCERLRGNCDFNFNRKKRERLTKIVKSDQECADTLWKARLLAEIEEMGKRCLCEINVSLMPSTGDLQGVQSKGLAFSREGGGGPYEFLDRPDTLVRSISIFYADYKKWDEIYAGMVDYDKEQAKRRGKIFCVEGK